MTLTPEKAPAATAGSSSSTHQVALAFEDGVTRFVTCREDQTVADASYRQRINIPLDCRDGACGTCKALCESGQYDGGTYIEDALSAAEAQDGYVLPCSMKPRSDLVLQIASTSEVAKTRAATYTSRIVGLDRISPTTIELAVEIPNRGELAFLPGQYVNITVPGAPAGDEPVTRSYSFSNAPHEERLTFLVKLTPGGAMSDYLTERAAIGDELVFTGPNGSFFLRETERAVLLLAGGTGLAPVLSMLRKLQAESSQRRAHLVYGVTSDDDLVKMRELDALADALANFTWDHCVSDPDSAAANKGYVTTLIRPEHLHDGDVAIYLCGPPPMVESVRAHVSDSGVEPTGFYYEKFALAVPAAEPAEARVAAVEDSVADPEQVLIHEDARRVAGQELLPAIALAAWPGAFPGLPDSGANRRIGGQELFVRHTPPEPQPAVLTPVTTSVAAPIETPVGTPAMAETTTPDGYMIGEEHPDLQASDALFEAREALELGALELTLGRLTSRQLAGYRLLAELTVPYVDAARERFTDAAAYTETNAAFHDYLLAQTGNAHLLEAYQALGVKSRMAEVLPNATWCHPRCAQDHLDIVEAFERSDREGARDLIVAHAERSKQTMRRAMSDEATSTRPRFVTPGRFAGQVVVVTGAAQGIGAQVARRIGAEGGTLVLADRSDLVGELSAELAAGGAESLPVICDLESYDGAASLVRQALARYGRIDVLVNNVGGAINFKPFTEFTPGEIDAEIARSLMTTLYACRAALPGMAERGKGVIVNVSSAATRGIHRIPYSAAKGGINAVTASLALEYADAGVRVVATAPGGTEAPPRRISRGTPEPRTEQERTWFQAHIDQTLEHSPMHRYGTLDEQAAAICFLASEEASYITGTVLPVAGGDPG